jgi:TetR/AcrR family transcriptional repressor of bet genes
MKASVRRDAANDTSQSIIDSALTLMVEDGLAGLTTKSVSKKADVSTAAIHYFFETKNNLIYSAFEFVIKTIRKDLLEVRKSEADPIARVRRSINVFFKSGQVSSVAAKVWPHLWVHAGSDVKTGRLFKIYNARLISNFTYDLCKLGVPRSRAKILAYKLNALHRGLWIEQQIGAPITRAECEVILDMFIAEVLAEL